MQKLFLTAFLLLGLALAGCGGEAPQQTAVENTSQTSSKAIAPAEKVNEKPVEAEQEKASATVASSEKKAVSAGPVVEDKSYILIMKSNFTLHYFDNAGQERFTASCALGKNPGQKTKRGDLKTPEGTFLIDEIIDSSSWSHDFGDGKGEIAGAYGPYFISLNTDDQSQGNWGGIGIHGTHDPASIGTLASEGCIRLRNEDVARLRPLVHVGMKVIIER